jgi:hypothetical protein
MENQAKYGAGADRVEKIEFKLYLGGNMKAEPIRPEHLQDFFEYIVANRLESYTVIKAMGTWRGMQEETMIIVFIGTDEDRTTVRAIGQIFKRQFLQESVFMTETIISTEEL